MNEVLQLISKIGIVPVIVIEEEENAVPLARALVEGGLPVAEITFRTDSAEKAIRAIKREVPEILVGAGTILSRDQLDRALTAGAEFIVTPGFNPSIVKYGLSKNALILPGTATGGEMEQAMAMGVEVVKFFPAEDNGGVKKLRAMAGPYTDLMWLPTGGINLTNLIDYLSFDRIIACGGTWMVKKDLIERKDWRQITQTCKEAVHTMLGIELAHVGINCDSEKKAKEMAEHVSSLLGYSPRQMRRSWFVGDDIEYMNQPGFGQNGHIAFKTNSVKRAMYHLSRKGIEFDSSSISYNSKGDPTLAYIKGNFGGFAIHLVNR